jgi:hypothetical protein
VPSVVVVVVVVVWICSLNFSENADCVRLVYKIFLSAVLSRMFLRVPVPEYPKRWLSPKHS